MDNKINFLLQQAKNIEDEESQSHFLNYICVMLSGYIEVNINKMLVEYKKSNPECKKSIITIQNATWCKIKPMLALIDLESTLKLNQKISETNIIDILYKIIGDRNNITHGKDITTLTLRELENSFDAIKSFIQQVEENFSHL